MTDLPIGPAGIKLNTIYPYGRDENAIDAVHFSLHPEELVEERDVVLDTLRASGDTSSYFERFVLRKIDDLDTFLNTPSVEVWQENLPLLDDIAKEIDVSWRRLASACLSEHLQLSHQVMLVCPESPTPIQTNLGALTISAKVIFQRNPRDFSRIQPVHANYCFQRVTPE